jgi:hypothetical protein
MTKLPPIDIDVAVAVVGKALQLTLAPFDDQPPFQTQESADNCVPLKVASAEPADEVTMKFTPPAVKPANA